MKTRVKYVGTPKKVMELTMKFYKSGMTLLDARTKAWRKYRYLQALKNDNPSLNKATVQ